VTGCERVTLSAWLRNARAEAVEGLAVPWRCRGARDKPARNLDRVHRRRRRLSNVIARRRSRLYDMNDDWRAVDDICREPTDVVLSTQLEVSEAFVSRKTAVCQSRASVEQTLVNLLQLDSDPVGAVVCRFS